MAETYWQLLKRPEWQKKRLQMLEAAHWECRNCGARDETLHVHHRIYIKGRKPWEYDDAQLEVLCNRCHEEAHSVGDELKELLSCVDGTEALALLRGFHAWNDSFDPMTGDIGRDINPYAHAIGVAAGLLTFLRPDQLKRAVAYAVSCSNEASEMRPLFENWASLFDELG